MKPKLQPLVIGDLELSVPIIQGAMGVKISTAPLIAEVASYGAAGTIASVGMGHGTGLNETDYIRASREGLSREVRKTRGMTRGVVGVNVMVALSNYENLVATAADEKVDFIASGAGLPLGLPGLVTDKSIKLIPIVSSGRAADIIIRMWKKRFDRMPDAFIVEGPLAGGHLGFSHEKLSMHGTVTLERCVSEVLHVVECHPTNAGRSIPVIAAGGIFDGSDAAGFFRLGARGVQLATRFVATTECDVPAGYKAAYVSATDADIVIIRSPVGMPARALLNPFVRRVLAGERFPFDCHYQCLKTCDPSTAPYCIADALFRVVEGDLDHGIIFCGTDVSKVRTIQPVRELLDELVEGIARSMSVE
jgi:NAD(P)H-dependent flavin oxidoreductase YrpB (nitropropane dioxygenase family)